MRYFAAAVESEESKENLLPTLATNTQHSTEGKDPDLMAWGEEALMAMRSSPSVPFVL